MAELPTIHSETPRDTFLKAPFALSFFGEGPADLSLRAQCSPTLLRTGYLPLAANRSPSLPPVRVEWNGMES